MSSDKPVELNRQHGVAAAPDEYYVVFQDFCDMPNWHQDEASELAKEAAELFVEWQKAESDISIDRQNKAVCYALSGLTLAGAVYFGNEALDTFFSIESLTDEGRSQVIASATRASVLSFASLTFGALGLRVRSQRLSKIKLRNQQYSYAQGEDIQ